MKIIVQKAELVRGLHRVLGIVESKQTMPILANVLLEAKKNNSIDISATNLEISLCAGYPADVEEAGAVAVPARKLYEIVKELPEDAVQLQSDDKNHVKLVSGPAKFKLMGLPKEEYPARPAVVQDKTFSIACNVLHDMLGKTVYAIAENDSRVALNGLLVHLVPHGAESNVRMVATDSHRLAIVEQHMNVKLDEQKLIIPKKAIAELRKFLDECEEAGAVQIGLNKNYAVFALNGAVMMSKLIDGEYPNYHQVIPPEVEKKVVVPKAMLSQTVRRVAIISAEKAKASIKIELSAGKMVVSSKNPGIGEAKEAVAVEYSGEDITLGMNPGYMLDALSTLDGDTAFLDFNGAVGPCRITGANGAGHVTVVMPMRA